LLVFAATSAETMIPRSMEKLERLVMPTGFPFNMDGTAIYMSIGILFLAHTLKVHLTVTEQFTTFLVMLFTSKGAAGVTGGGFVALAATLPAVYGRDLGCHQPDQQCHRDAGCGSDCDHARQVLGSRRKRSKVDAARGHVGGLVRSMRFGRILPADKVVAIPTQRALEDPVFRAGRQSLLIYLNVRGCTGQFRRLSRQTSLGGRGAPNA